MFEVSIDAVPLTKTKPEGSAVTYGGIILQQGASGHKWPSKGKQIKHSNAYQQANALQGLSK